MDQEKKTSNLDNYVAGNALAFKANMKIVAGGLGMCVAYFSFDGTLPVNGIIKYLFIFFGLAVSILSFYSLFKKN